jgi:hypothetical protein
MNYMKLEEVSDVIAQSRGVVELGAVSFDLGGKTYHVGIEESNIHGNHRFDVFLENPDEDLNPEICQETGVVLDPEFIRFIEDEYRSKSVL